MERGRGSKGEEEDGSLLSQQALRGSGSAMYQVGGPGEEEDLVFSKRALGELGCVLAVIVLLENDAVGR